jgi:RNA polymerase sigma-70 factor (ECF subfamily)
VEDPPIASLYDRYAVSIFAYVRGRLASREDAEDMLLEVFVAALEHEQLASVPEAERLAWLRRVAYYKLVDHYRYKKRWSRVALDDVADTLEEDEALAPEQVVLRQEEQSHVRAALQRLPRLQQEVLRLRFSVGLCAPEIAALLGKREGAVRMMLSRALRLLRTLYEEQEGGKPHGARRTPIPS